MANATENPLPGTKMFLIVPEDDETNSNSTSNNNSTKSHLKHDESIQNFTQSLATNITKSGLKKLPDRYASTTTKLSKTTTKNKPATDSKFNPQMDFSLDGSEPS